MNWNIFKKADVESKDRLKCSQCHVYLPENYLEPKCEYCLGIKTRKIKVHKPEPVLKEPVERVRSGPEGCLDRTTAEPIQDLDLELHGSEGPADRRYTSTSDMKLKSGKCESCGAVVPGLISRYCINCYMVIRYG